MIIFQPLISQPLKDLNYGQVCNDMRQRGVNKTDTATTMEEGKQKPKISLMEYRERVKSKSPAQPVNQPRKPDVSTNDKPSNQDRVAEMAQLTNPGIREEGADDIADVSLDMGSMSIDQGDANLDDKTGTLVENGKEVKKVVKLTKSTSERTENRLKLKKSVSLTNAGEKGTGNVLRSDKSDSSLLIKADEHHAKPAGDKDDLFNLPLSERLRMNSNPKSQSSPESVGQSQKPGGSQIIQTGSPDFIDLTEDEESPVPEPVRPKQLQPIKSKDTFQDEANKPISNYETFGASKNHPIATFEALNRQPAPNVIHVPPKQSQQWTQARDPSNSAPQGFKPAANGLAQLVQDDITRRNKLVKLLEKQKVCSVEPASWS